MIWIEMESPCRWTGLLFLAVEDFLQQIPTRYQEGRKENFSTPKIRTETKEPTEAQRRNMRFSSWDQDLEVGDLVRFRFGSEVRF